MLAKLIKDKLVVIDGLLQIDVSLADFYLTNVDLYTISRSSFDFDFEDDRSYFMFVLQNANREQVDALLELLETENTQREIIKEKENPIKVFISHSSNQKRQANWLKTNLEYRGLSAFVAHDDIGMSEDWQKEIELNLQSADVFLLLLTEDSLGSFWVNQEIGYVHRKGVPIIVLSEDMDSPGFIHYLQAKKIAGLFSIRSDPDKFKRAAKLVCEYIHSRDILRARFELHLTKAISTSSSYEQTYRVAEHLEKVTSFDDEMISNLEAAVHHDQVKQLSEPVRKLKEIIGRHAL